jgi:hypothetical protein
MAASGWVEALATAPEVADLDGPDPADGLDEAAAPTVAEVQVSTADQPGPHADLDLAPDPGSDLGSDLGSDFGSDLGSDFGSGFDDGGGGVDLLDGLDETSYADGSGTDVPDVAAEAVGVADDTGDDSAWDEDAYDEPVNDGEGPALT